MDFENHPKFKPWAKNSMHAKKIWNCITFAVLNNLKYLPENVAHNWYLTICKFSEIIFLHFLFLINHIKCYECISATKGNIRQEFSLIMIIIAIKCSCNIYSYLTERTNSSVKYCNSWRSRIKNKFAYSSEYCKFVNWFVTETFVSFQHYLHSQ